MNDHEFNDGLGEKLRSAGDTPQTTGKTKRIASAGLIALVATAVVLIARYGIGN